MAGYGNHTNSSPSPTDPSLTREHTTTRFSREDSHAYTGEHDNYGSGATGGAGFGNKSASDAAPSVGNDVVRLGSTRETGPYMGYGERVHKSGTVGGAGWGNKTGSFGESHDSIIGRIIEKTGNVMHNEGLVAKGRERRRSSGFRGEEIGVSK